MKKKISRQSPGISGSRCHSRTFEAAYALAVKEATAAAVTAALEPHPAPAAPAAKDPQDLADPPERMAYLVYAFCITNREYVELKFSAGYGIIHTGFTSYNFI